MAAATAEPKAVTTTLTVALRSVLRKDGTFKHSLPASEAKRLQKACQVCGVLSLVPSIELKAKAARDALVELINEVSEK